MNAVQHWMDPTDGARYGSQIWVPYLGPLRPHRMGLRPHRLLRQQGGGGVMFCSVIFGNELVGTFRVPDDVKLTAVVYIDFLKQNILPWFKKKPLTFKKKMVFMHDNAPSHAAKLTSDILATVSLKCEKLMTWPACSPDLNPIKNMWAMLKRRIYESGRFRQKESCGPQYFIMQTILLQVRTKN